MNDNEQSTLTAQDKAKALFESLNLPFSISAPAGAVKDGWECIHYVVTIGTEHFFYSLGIGHVKWRAQAAYSITLSVPGVDLFTVENIVFNMAKGKQIRAEYKLAVAKIAAALAKIQKVEPKPWEVLAAVCREGQDAEMSFANWCADFGYDEDSRKALAIYDACTENGKRARRLLSQADYLQFVNLASEF